VAFDVRVAAGTAIGIAVMRSRTFDGRPEFLPVTPDDDHRRGHLAGRDGPSAATGSAMIRTIPVHHAETARQTQTLAGPAAKLG
jgi:hypothetical protein